MSPKSSHNNAAAYEAPRAWRSSFVGFLPTRSIHAFFFVPVLVFLGMVDCHHATRAETQVFAWNTFHQFGTPPAEATNIVAIAGGDGHIAALRADGRVFAWGQNDYGQTNVPPDVTNAVRIAAGSTHSLALLDDGTARFWGNIYTTGVTNPPPTVIQNMVGFAAGPSAQHVLSIRSDGLAVDWGNSNSSYHLPSVPASATNAVDASAASFHALVLRADGRPVAWGVFGSYGGLGTPVVPASATNVVAVASGFNHDLALRADGSLVSWGIDSSYSIIPDATTNITAVASGGWQAAALRADGQVLQWSPGGQAFSAPSYVSNVVALATTTSGLLALSASDGPPLLGRMPRNPILQGTTARFRPLVISTTPLSYQWMCSGTNLPGATDATLVLSNAQLGHAGTYTLVVSNAFGAVTNSDLAPNVLPLLIQVVPQSQTVAGGSNVTFAVTAIGSGPFSYQWQTNGTVLAGATTNPLVLPNVQMSQAGLYSVVISNTYGAVTSPSAALTVAPLFITSQPRDALTYVSGAASFSVAAAGKGPYSYQWRLYGTNLPSATSNSLVRTNLQLADAGPYSVIVSNAFGAVQSSNALLTVAPILISVQPQSQAAFLGQTITFTVTAQGSPPFSYQWQWNGAELGGATASSLTLTNCQYDRIGAYRVVIRAGAATTNSADASLTVSQVASWGSQGQASVPVNLSNLVAFAAHSGHILALKPDKTVARWGDTGTVPAGLTNVVALAPGASHDLVLLDDGTVVAWGDNSYGQASPPNNLTSALAVAAGDSFSLALKPDGTLAAWGSNAEGETNVPPDLTNVVAISAGALHSLALRVDGTVGAWGDSGLGETNVPAGLSNIVAIAAGGWMSMALQADGRVVVWGDPINGEQTVPASATNVVAIATGYAHCLALKSDGTVVAWGNPQYRETQVPVDLHDVMGVAACYAYSLALVSDGILVPTAVLTSPAWGPGGFSVSLPSRSGRVYLLEYKNSPDDANWTALPLVAGTGGMLTLRDPTANGARRFYRVRQW